jgi:hypothetical protein
MSHSIAEKHKTEDAQDLLLYQLTQEEQSFVLALMEGKTQCDAYLVANPETNRNNAYVMGSRWANRGKIQAARDELLELQASEALRILRGAVQGAAKTVALASSGEQEIDAIRLKAATEVLDRTGAIARHGLDITQGRQQDLRGFIEADDAGE